MQKALLALTMGDPAGVGPEIVARACLHPQVQALSLPLVVGHAEVLRRAVAALGTPVDVRVVEDVASERDAWDRDGIACLHVGSDDVLAAPPARVDARCGRAAYDSVVAATRLALHGDVDGIVTAPLNKEALAAASVTYPGHTELLADLCGVDEFAMMLYLGPGDRVRGPHGLGVAHVTLHMALADVFARLDTAAVAEKIRLCHDAMRRFGAARPRIGVAALNPHAGEQGLFGDEEQRVIAPAVRLSSDEGIDVAGPFPADTLMVRAAAGEFDGVVAMYHDQGHIALKLLGMFDAVNVTLGLPIVRTSVAHGTAFDLVDGASSVGRTPVSITGMIAAVRAASLLARRASVGHGAPDTA
ncbi:MAG: 4-hydroxythreonine-4-phosphate dehydrogenase PdxA [Planctomycetales bacterium]|nr:4-hydroxythreonine-4-phosphate dehydrogenase PdxA [Planctomycetales bacterium]